MGFYIMLYIAVLIIAIPCYLPKKLSKKQKDMLYLTITGGLLAFLSAIRYDIGFDYSYVYAPFYEKILQSPITNIFNERHEIGFVILEYITASFSQNFQMVFVVTSILLILLYFVYFYKYSCNMVMSVAMFMLWGYYFCSMNFVRQTIASGIFLYAVQSVIEKKPIKYVLITLLAASFHKSALIMLPFYFILQIKINKKVLVLYCSAVAFIFSTSHIFLEFATEKWFTWYNLNDWHISRGYPWITAILPVIMFIIFYTFSDVLERINPQYSVLVSSSFFSAFFFVIALKHSILDRFSLYFEPVMLVGTTYIITGLYEQLKKSKEKSNIRRTERMKKKFYAVSAVISVISVFQGWWFLYFDGHCVIPYQTIYDQEFYQLYVQSLEEGTGVFAGEYDEDIVEPVMLPED